MGRDLWYHCRRRTKKGSTPDSETARGSKATSDTEHAYTEISISSRPTSQLSQHSQNAYEAEKPGLPPDRTLNKGCDVSAEAGYDLPCDVLKLDESEPGNGKAAVNGDYSYAYGHFEGQGRQQANGPLGAKGRPMFMLRETDKPPVGVKPHTTKSKRSVPVKSCGSAGNPGKQAHSADGAELATDSKSANLFIPARTATDSGVTHRETCNVEQKNTLEELGPVKGKEEREIVYAVIVPANDDDSDRSDDYHGNDDADLVITDNDLYNT